MRGRLVRLDAVFALEAFAFRGRIAGEICLERKRQPFTANIEEAGSQRNCFGALAADKVRDKVGESGREEGELGHGEPEITVRDAGVDRVCEGELTCGSEVIGQDGSP